MNKPREWLIYGVIAAEKGSAAYDEMRRRGDTTPVVEKGFYDDILKAHDEMKAQACKASGVNPTHYHIAETEYDKLTKERDDALKEIACLRSVIQEIRNEAALAHENGCNITFQYVVGVIDPALKKANWRERILALDGKEARNKDEI